MSNLEMQSKEKEMARGGAVSEAGVAAASEAACSEAAEAGVAAASEAAHAGALEAVPGAGRRRSGGAFGVLYQKELRDYVSSWRVMILFILLIVVTGVSLNGAIGNISDVADSTDFLFLKLFTTGGASTYSFAVFVAFLGPLVGISMGFDAIINEKSQGTLIRLASQPIYRDSIINAKFLAGASVIFFIVFFLGGLMSGVGILNTGIAPSGEEVARLVVFLLYMAVYISLWLAIAIFLSTVCRHAATSAIIALALWLFLTLFMSLTASGIANAVYPTEGIQGYYNLLNNYQLNLALNRISPYYLFSEVTSTVLNPNVRSVGITTMAQYDGAVAGYLSFSQSVLLIWPHLVAMIALAAAAFGAAYISFMRREIRA